MKAVAFPERTDDTEAITPKKQIGTHLLTVRKLTHSLKAQAEPVPGYHFVIETGDEMSETQRRSFPFERIYKQNREEQNQLDSTKTELDRGQEAES